MKAAHANKQSYQHAQIIFSDFPHNVLNVCHIC